MNKNIFILKSNHFIVEGIQNNICFVNYYKLKNIDFDIRLSFKSLSNFLLLVTKLQSKFLSELLFPYLSNGDKTRYLCCEELLVLTPDMALMKVTSFLVLTSLFSYHELFK